MPTACDRKESPLATRDWSRREVLLALGAASLAGPLAAAPRAKGAAAGPPVARVEPVTDELWGEKIVDPYRWMENAKDPDWQPFMRAQAAWTRSVLDRIPGRKRLRARIAALSGVAAITRNVQSAGGRVFYEQRPQGADSYQLFVRSAAGGASQLLVDPTVLKQDGKHVSLDWWLAAPTGRHVVYGLSAAGSEDSVIQVVEVDTHEILPERIDRAETASPSWLPDGSGFFFNRLAEGATRGSLDYFRNSVAWLHRLRTNPQQDLRVLAHGQYAAIPSDPSDFPIVLADPACDYVLALTLGGVRRENPYYTARLADLLGGQPQWRRVCDLADEVIGTAFAGDTLWLLTTREAPNGKVLRTSLSAPDLARATAAVPESETVIDAISAARDGLYVQDMNAGYGGLRRLAADGRLAPVAMPFDGSVLQLSTQTGEDGAFWIGASWLVPATVLHFDPTTGRSGDTGLSPRPAIDLAPYEAIRSFATVRDGTRVPVSIIARRGLARDGRHPLLVNAYGSYQIVYSPSFDARRIAFLEQGGVLAIAHVRGGGEYGKRWWKAGQKLTKPNTWRDLIDCCETLVRDGWTSPARLAIQGGSAGGITVGRAMTERPGLCAAVISNVGATNSLRSEFTANGPPNIVEFGTVKERDGFEALRQMDAYQAVRDGMPYPAVLVTTGMTDPRVEPWEAAKMAARLQKATASDNPVLLRVTFDEGHGFGSTRTQIDDERADEYAFVLWRTGRAGFQPTRG